MYLNRYDYRNDDSIIGHTINSFWNLNRLDVDNRIENKSVKIVWECEGDKAVLYNSNSGIISTIPNKYGTNLISVYVDGERIKGYGYMKNKWWITFDFNFHLKNDSITLQTDPEIYKSYTF
jgi:hypothetical protein